MATAVAAVVYASPEFISPSLGSIMLFYTIALWKKLACLQTDQDQRTRVQSMSERYHSLSSEFLD